MKVRLGIQIGIAVLRVGRAVASNTGTRVVRHVVDHGVDGDPDACRIAARHHVPELRAGARAAARDAVTHRLVALTPIVGRDDAVFLRWRDLYCFEAGWTEYVLAFARDVCPFPLEEVHEDIAGGHVPGGPIC